MSEHRKIVVGVDSSPASLQAVKWAANQAKSRDSSIEIIQTWSIPFTSGPTVMIPMAFPIEMMDQDAPKIVTAAIATATSIESKIQVVDRVQQGCASEHSITVGKSADPLVLDIGDTEGS